MKSWLAALGLLLASCSAQAIVLKDGDIKRPSTFADTLCGTNEILEDLGSSWRCVTFPTGITVQARLWNNGVPIAGGLTTTPAVDTCLCYLHAIPVGIEDLDVIRLAVPNADADDHVELGVFSESGATRYFQAEVVVTVTGHFDLSNTTATPSAMTPANYWVCLAMNNAAPNSAFRGNNAGLTVREEMAEFQQACVGGVIPATLTAPTITFTLPPAGNHDLWWQLQDR